jgi:solute carrier family 25 phosphate transporter 23/24/25/41
MQCETTKDGPHGWKLIKKTYAQLRKQGGFYRGLGAGVGGMFPYAAIDLGTFDLLKKTFKKRNIRKDGLTDQEASDVELTQLQTGSIGAFSGAFGATAVYPVNLLRTRLQTQGTAVHRRTYEGFADCFRQTVEHEGYRGLYKGLTPNLLKVVPAVAIVSQD